MEERRNHPDWQGRNEEDLLEMHKNKVYKIDRVTEEVRSETSRLNEMVAEAKAEADPERKKELVRDIQESLLGMCLCRVTMARRTLQLFM